MVIDSIVEKYKASEIIFKKEKKLMSELFFLLNNLSDSSKREKTVLAKPQTLMNNSGKIVREIVNHFKIKSRNLWVIHDDLDLRLGSYKIQFAVGPKLHLGVASIEEELATKDFWRVRIGIDNRAFSREKVEGRTYVLENFSAFELKIIKEVIKEVIPQIFLGKPTA